jgi:2,3-bisphosphoglycerate-independent phosphoglycerate mutase
MLITADHGNVEQMNDPTTGQAHTAHTSGPVPLVYLGPQPVEFGSGGVLADVAPTLLTLMRIDVPAEMTGRSLVKLQERRTA